MRKAIGTPHVLWIFKKELRIEIADLSPDFAIVPAGIKRVDYTNAANTVLEIRPKRLERIADWRRVELQRPLPGALFARTGRFDHPRP